MLYLRKPDNLWRRGNNILDRITGECDLHEPGKYHFNKLHCLSTSKTYSASCQQSVNVAKTCNNIASANVTTGTANHCTSGTVTIYTSVGAEWWGMNPNYGIPNPIGSAVISCAADNSSATVTLTASGWINSPTVYNLSANTPSSGTASIYYGISVPWSWSGGTLSGGGANGSGAGGFIVKVNLGTSSATIVTPTNSNGCSSLANM